MIFWFQRNCLRDFTLDKWCISVRFSAICSICKLLNCDHQILRLYNQRFQTDTHNMVLLLFYSAKVYRSL